MLDGLEPWTRVLLVDLGVDSMPVAPGLVLGRAIRRFRLWLGWTQMDLALAVDVAVQTVRAWERGAAWPQERHLDAMRARGFRVPRAAIEPRMGRRDKPGSLLGRRGA